MLSPPLQRATARFSSPTRTPPRQRRWLTDANSLGRRLANFWLVWSALLLVHELGHVLVAVREGHAVQRVTIGMGPVVWRGTVAGTEGVLRAVPLAGLTDVVGLTSARDWNSWKIETLVLAGGVLATFAFGLLLSAAVATRERWSGTRWLWARHVIADLAVLTVLNMLPVPPLDGGRALIAAVTALRSQPLSSNAVFWLQAGGFALAVVPVAFWTRWTKPIDVAAARWGAPRR